MTFKNCEKKDCKNQRKYHWYWWLFPITGLAALIWFLIRVVPKPSRASYPCQRVAAPLAGSFIVWFVGVIGSITLYRKVKDFFKRLRFGWGVVGLVVLLAAGIVTLVTMPEKPVIAANSQPNAPRGDAKGIHPGRVVWAYNPDATDWAGYESPEHWWESEHTNLTVVEQMISQVIRGVTGESTDHAAWDAIFRYNNQRRGKGNVGYQTGEKIAIKLNMSTCLATANFVDPQTYNKNSDLQNRVDNSPHAVLALLRQLVITVGAAQEDITVGDSTAMFPNCYWNILYPEFPRVRYWDNYGGSGRTRAEFSNIPFYWSTTDADGKVQDYLPEAVAEADYLINFAVLKGHSAGVSLCGKNHYGTLIRCPNGRLRDEGILDYYNLHLSLPNAVWSPGLGHYRSLVDLMGHPQIGGKTMLYLIDGLFAGYYWEAQPRKWTSSPFGDGVNGDWPSSFFASLDPVAIDSVAYDFLLTEWPDVVTRGDGASLQGGAEDYLHEAAQANNPPSGTFYDPDRDGNPMASQGVHEHWNNAADKMYSRNLGTGDGIELFRVYNITGSPSQIALDRDQLNFGYILGGNNPAAQSFRISNAAAGASSWIVDEDFSWLSCTPTSGNNPGLITVSVNPQGKTAGTYTGTITVTNLNSTASPLSLQVTLKIYAKGTDSVPFGSFDTPVNGSTVRSSIPVTGWALDDVAVENVKIYRNPVPGEGSSLVYIGDGIFVEGARPDVAKAKPGYPNNYKAGWGYMLLTNFLPNQGNGVFTLHAVVSDSSGHQVSLGTKTITCDNVNAVKPFGAIDTPAQGGTASGSAFIDWGWALTPQPNNIPIDGSTIKVWVDGVNLGHPNYNNYRKDIAVLFPGYANSNGAAGYFYLDTTAYDNGVHTIQWTVKDSAGNIDGIGSRYFTIQNTGGSAVRMAQSEKRKAVAFRVMSRGQGGLPPCFKNIQDRQDRGQALPMHEPRPLIPVDPSFPGPIHLEKGYNENKEPQKIYPDKNGTISVEIRELERVEVHFFQSMLNISTLPIGSTFDPETGVFCWQPGAGFLGEHKFHFISKENNGKLIGRQIKIKIVPKFPK
jgi:hypothetical protein